MGIVKSIIAAGTGYGYSGYDRILPTSMGGQSATGMPVNTDTALKLSAWFGANRILADQFALSAVKYYKRTKNGGREQATENPLWALLMRKPNSQQNAYTFKHSLFNHRFWDGNHYSYIQKSEAGLTVGLVPLAPWRVRVKQRADLSIVYEYLGSDNQWETYTTDEIFHWIGPSRDGIIGMSLIHYAADNIGIATKRQQHQENILENRAVPSGIISAKNKLSSKDFDDFTKKVRANYEGPRNSGKILIVDNDTKFERSAMTNQDMQYIEDKQMDIGDVNRFTGVPSVLLGDMAHSTFNNMVEANKLFLKYGLNPHLCSFEMELNTKLIPKHQQDKFFFEFDRTDFDKMDNEKQSEWIKNMVYSCAMSPNEARAQFNVAPIDEEWANMPLRPENMAPANAPYVPKNSAIAPAPTEDPAPADKKKADKKVKGGRNSEIKDAFSGAFQQIYGRMLTKTSGKFDSLFKKHGAQDCVTPLREFLKEQTSLYASELRPTVLALAVSVSEVPLSMEALLDKATLAIVDEFATNVMVESGMSGRLEVNSEFGAKAVDSILKIIEVYGGE